MSAASALPPLAVDAATLALAQEVRADLDAWADRWPIFDRKRFPALALTTAVHLPELARPARALAALASLWIIAFDEIVDEERADDAAIARQVAAFRELIAPEAAESRDLGYGTSDSAIQVHPRRGGHGGPPGFGGKVRPSVATDQGGHAGPPLRQGRSEVPRHSSNDFSRLPVPDDGLAAALGTVVAAVEASPMFPAFAAEWRRSFLRMVDATVEQHQLGRLRLDGAAETARPALPSYDAMLALTTESISVRWYLLTGFILSNDATLAQHADALLAIADSCARAIRLANDLRSWERDLAEGSANTLTALEAELAAANPCLPATARRAQALELLQERLTVAVAATARLLAASPLAGSPALVGVERLLVFITGVYARSEFAEFSPSAVAPHASSP